MLSFFLVTGLSYLIYALTFFDFAKVIGLYTPWLMLFFSFPHFMGTYWVWISRVTNWKNEWFPLLFPLLFTGIFLLAYKGWPGSSSLEWVLKISYLYLLYHFAQQLYGVTLWVAARVGVFYSPKRKWLMRLLFLFSSLYAWLEIQVRGHGNILFYHPVSSWEIHSRYITLCFLIVLILSCLNIFFCFYDFLQKKNLKSFLVLAPIGLTWLWFLPPINLNMVFLLPVLHGIQYFPFIWMKGRHNGLKKWLGIYSGCLFLGWILFRWLPFSMPFQSLEGSLWSSLILSMLNNHHFLIDGRIWKLRDPQNQDLLTSSPVPQSQAERVPS